MIRLLVLCDTVGREGGTEAYLGRVLPELARTGIDITLAARRVLDPRAFGIAPVQIPWAAESESPSLAAAARVRELIETMRPRAVLTSNVFDAAVLATARKARRFIVRLHDHRAFCPNGDRLFPQFPGNCGAPMGGACMVNALVHGCIAGPHLQTVDRLQARIHVRDEMRTADALIVSSRFMADLCARNGIRHERIVIAPPPVESESYLQASTQKPGRRVLFAGRILPQKGLASLVRALGYIHEERRPVLAVAGEPAPELTRAQQLAIALGVSIKVLGYLSHTELFRAIDASRALIVPSLWNEPFGLIGIEAQARGRPAVAYAVGGISEWLGDAGIAVEPGDERALARAIERVISAEHWDSYAGAALRRATEFHPSHHVRILQEVLCA